MTPIEALQTIGLSEKETAVYLACLELGQDAVSAIAKKSGLKRPTTYLVLDALQKRGLLNTVTKGKRTLYGVEEPMKLMSLVAEKDRALRTILPHLEAINNRNTTKPRIRFFEGREGLHRVYEEIFEAKEMRFFGSIDAIKKNIPEILTWFEQLSITKKPKTFDLLTDTPEDRAYASRVVRPGYDIRFFPKDVSFSLDATIFGNKLAMNAFTPEFHGFIIESEEIVRAVRALWELAWSGGTPFRSRTSNQ